MKKVITMGLNSKSIDNAIKELLSYKKWLKDSAQRLIEELTKIGLDVSRARLFGSITKIDKDTGAD